MNVCLCLTQPPRTGTGCLGTEKNIDTWINFHDDDDWTYPFLARQGRIGSRRPDKGIDIGLKVACGSAPTASLTARVWKRFYSTQNHIHGASQIRVHCPRSPLTVLSFMSPFRASFLPGGLMRDVVLKSALLETGDDVRRRKEEEGRE